VADCGNGRHLFVVVADNQRADYCQCDRKSRSYYEDVFILFSRARVEPRQVGSRVARQSVRGVVRVAGLARCRAGDAALFIG
jgi:hypothetical protein